MGEIQRHIYQDVLLEGHLIDSNILSRIMGNVMELGGDFEFLTLDIGRQNTDPSRVRMRPSVMKGRQNSGKAKQDSSTNCGRHPSTSAMHSDPAK